MGHCPALAPQPEHNTPEALIDPGDCGDPAGAEQGRRPLPALYHDLAVVNAGDEETFPGA